MIFFCLPEGGFALGACVTPDYAQAVLYSLSSNFLEVKQLSCTLLQKLPRKTVGLEVRSNILQGCKQEHVVHLSFFYFKNLYIL